MSGILTISRRFFCKLLLATGLAAIPRMVNKNVIPAIPPSLIDHKTLAAYLDVLIPDDISPGAVKLGITELLLKHAKSHPDDATLLSQGCAWLNAQTQIRGQEKFSQCTSIMREEIVQLASENPNSSLSYRFFLQSRHIAFQHYYAHPQALKLLAYSGPPQPSGYLDYKDPPVELLQSQGHT